MYVPKVKAQKEIIMSGTYVSDSSDASSVDSDVAELPPMRLCARPPQFPKGKTATSLTEMEAMTNWFLDSAQEYDILHQSHRQRFKRIVHLIFVNNNLIEGDQWKDRMIKRGIQNLKIFSSKSDVNGATELKQLITEGEYDVMTDQYTPIDYVLMCTNATRLQNFCCDPKNNTILRRVQDFHPEIGFVLWFDEIDKFVKLHSEYIPRFQQFPNVIVLNGITATPYSKFWKIMHSCGYHDISLIGTLPDPSDYRSIKDHTLLYSDLIKDKSPVKHLEFILENPDKVMYDENGIKHKIPNLTDNKKRIIFAPGESTCKTHNAIKRLGFKYGKNTLMINGKHKGFFKPSSSPEGEYISVRDYKNRKIQNNVKHEGHSFNEFTAMDIAIIMYNDPELNLNSTDLIITGFHCVERGVTFNRPNFQFTHGIFSRYHYTESSDLVESIVQIAGRCMGNKEWVPAGIVIISPKYITDTVEQTIFNIIEFLQTNPKSIQYADIYRERHGIPIMVTFNDPTVLAKIVEIKKLKKSDMEYIQKLLQEAHASNKITLIDNNHVDSIREPFTFNEYTISGKRILEEGNDPKNYRFDKFYENFINRKCYGQSVKEKGQFQFDITMIDYKISDEYTLPKHTGFISFVYKPQI